MDDHIYHKRCSLVLPRPFTSHSMLLHHSRERVAGWHTECPRWGVLIACHTLIMRRSVIAYHTFIMMRAVIARDTFVFALLLVLLVALATVTTPSATGRAKGWWWCAGCGGYGC